MRPRDADHGEPLIGWFATMMRAQSPSLFTHVRLVYPLADTEITVRVVFERARWDEKPSDVSTRAWLRRIARQVVVAEGELEAARRNVDAVRYGLYGAIESVPNRRPELESVVAALGGLTVPDQELLRMSSIEDLELDELAWIFSGEPDVNEEQLEGARERFRLAYTGVVDDESIRATIA